MSNRTSSDALPSRFGRYRIFSKLASGGMATVYLARTEHRTGFEKIVALKVIHDHLAGEAPFVEMFLDEARLAASIDHPNVCSVFDFGEHDGVYYLAMEYLLGEPTKRIARTIAKRKDKETIKRLPWYVARIIADASEGLHAAHELCGPGGEPLGVVHRDVSPENIVVTYDGGVKIVDFGVAKAAERIHQTKVSKIKGKFAYVAPEQVRNEEVDRRADVWGLGVCLWESLTLRRLFRRDSDAATLSAVVFDDIPAPSEISPWVPPALDKVVLRALSRDREQRYRTARALGQDLRKFLTRSGTTVGAAELSEWMESLFPHEREARLSALRRARQGKPSDSFPAVTDEGSVSSESMPSVSALVSPEEAAALRAEVSLQDFADRLRRRGRTLSSDALGLVAIDLCEVLRDRPTAVDAGQIALSLDGKASLRPPFDPCRASDATRGLLRCLRSVPVASGPLAELLRGAEFTSPAELHVALVAAIDPIARGHARRELAALCGGGAPGSELPSERPPSPVVDPLVRYAEDTAAVRTHTADGSPVLHGIASDELARQMKSGGIGRVALALVLLLGGAAAVLAIARPAWVRGWLGLEPEPPAQEPAAEAPEPSAGELVLHLQPPDARVLLFEGRSPVDVPGVPQGAPVQLLTTLEGRGDTWVEVPAETRWTEGRADLAVALRDADDAQPIPPPVQVPPRDAPRGVLHVVTTPPGAKLFRAIGTGPELRVGDLPVERALELLVLREGHEPHRELLSPRDWRSVEGAPRVERTVALREKAQAARRRPRSRRRREPSE